MMGNSRFRKGSRELPGGARQYPVQIELAPKLTAEHPVGCYGFPVIDAGLLYRLVKRVLWSLKEWYRGGLPFVSWETEGFLIEYRIMPVPYLILA